MKETIEHLKSEKRALEEQVFVLQKRNSLLEGEKEVLVKELEGIRSSSLIGPMLKLAHTKAVVIEDIRLNRGAAIRRKLYRKTVEKPYTKVRDAYIKSRLEYVVVDNEKWDDSKPLVSVVIPFYNRHDTIDDTIRSLELQTFTDFEVIIVDDGSSAPETKKCLDKVAKSPLKPTILKQTNAGVAQARNNGIAQARGKYIVCLDSDDELRPMHIEKSVSVLESDPSIALVTTGIEAFGVSTWSHVHQPYDPAQLFVVNLASTASVYRREAWEAAGGYKSKIGYEDWDLWLSMAEKGYWGRRIPELLFRYRTAIISRFVEDRSNHDANVKMIQGHHPNYYKQVRSLRKMRRYKKEIINPSTAFINMDRSAQYGYKNKRPHAMLLMPWMTFGGAETLIVNFSKEIVQDYDVTFVTGLHSAHEWQERFEAVSDRIYHLPNLFDSPAVYLEFLSNYITTHNVSIIHILHTNFAHYMLEELKRRHPELKIIITMFNSRVDHFPTLKDYLGSIDMLTSDNHAVQHEFLKLGAKEKATRVIPNGINATQIFNPDTYNRAALRSEFKLQKDDIGVFFIGRLSPEKNPDVFVDVAASIASRPEYKRLKFFVVGDGPMRPTIEKTIQKLSNIEFIGYRSDIAQILCAADIFVLPSSIEGFPLSILEAMASDCVCVASAVGAVPDIIKEGENGFVVEPGNHNAIISSLFYLHDNQETLVHMQKQSRDTVLKLYSSEVLGANYRKLYKDVRR